MFRTSGLMVTVAAIAVLARSAFADHRPPDLTVMPEVLRPVGAGCALEVKVLNNGDMAAAAVEIEGEADGEKSGATLDYVPGHGEKRATLVFSSDEKPQARVRITGWSDPRPPFRMPAGRGRRRREPSGLARRWFSMQMLVAFLLVILGAVPVAMGLFWVSRTFRRIGRGWSPGEGA